MARMTEAAAELPVRDGGAALDIRRDGRGKVVGFRLAWDARPHQAPTTRGAVAVRQYRDHPLDYYADRALLSDRQWVAGMRFARLQAANFPGAQVTPRYEHRVKSHDDDVLDERAERDWLAHKGALAVVPRHAQRALMEVCGTDPRFPTELGGRDRLVAALDALVRLWRIPSDAERVADTDDGEDDA